MIKYKIKKGDTAVVISGAEKGKRGAVLEVDRTRGRVLVEGVNLRKRAMRRSQERPQGGIVEKELPIHISNVMEQTRYEAKVEPKRAAAAQQEA